MTLPYLHVACEPNARLACGSSKLQRQDGCTTYSTYSTYSTYPRPTHYLPTTYPRPIHDLYMTYTLDLPWTYPAPTHHPCLMHPHPSAWPHTCTHHTCIQTQHPCHTRRSSCATASRRELSCLAMATGYRPLRNLRVSPSPSPPYCLLHTPSSCR